MARINEQTPVAGPKRGEQNRSASSKRADVEEKPSAASVEEAHIGATEEQVTPTTPPSPTDDEPKQG
jgi:hypothetical protein